MKNLTGLLHIGNKAKSQMLKKIINYYIRLVYCCDIPCQTSIGKNVTLAHRGLGCVIHKDTIIGNNVFIQHRVTIGVKRSNEGAPVLENGVAVGPGAIIIGNIRIGENSVIGAGAVVTHDVPPYTVVGGVPAKVIYYLDK